MKIVLAFFWVLVCGCGGSQPKNIQTQKDHIQGSYIVAWDLESSDPSDSMLNFSEFVPKQISKLLYGAESLGVLGDSRIHLTRLDFFDDEEAKKFFAPKVRPRRILFAEPNRLNRMYSSPYAPDQSDRYLAHSNPDYLDDPIWWWQKQIKLPEALNKLVDVGGESLSLLDERTPVIAVLDSGIDVQHPALEGRIWENPYQGQLGCINDQYGCNTTQAKAGTLGNGDIYPYGTSGHGQPCPSYEGEPNSFCIHGTHVAGLIAGDVYNGMGGVCPVCKILPLKVVDNLRGDGGVTDSSILAAMFYLLRLKEKDPGRVRIANTSFGKFQKSKALELVLRLLHEGKDGILMVAASGNEDTQKRVFPAAFDQVVSVGAFSYLGHKAPYSNFGTWVDVMAPGGSYERGRNFGLFSAVPGGGYNYNQGTSMAAPIVAGVLGLMLALNPELTPSELKATLKLSADERIYSPDAADGLNYKFYYPELSNQTGVSGRIALLGQGLLDASRALELVQDSDSSRRELRLSQERKVVP